MVGKAERLAGKAGKAGKVAWVWKPKDQQQGQEFGRKACKMGRKPKAWQEGLGDRQERL